MSGLLVTLYETEDAAVEAVRQLVRQHPKLRVDVHSPYHLEEIDELLPTAPYRVSLAVFGGAAIGAALAYFLQYVTAVYLYPFRVAGMPLHSWPSFLPITFEMGVLCSAFCCLGSILFLAGLPRYHHPIFSLPGFERTSSDRFAVAVELGEAGSPEERASVCVILAGGWGGLHEL